MIYTNRRKFRKVIKIDNVAIEAVNELKYLGIILDEKYSYIKHIECTLRKAQTELLKILNRKRILSCHSKMCIYKQLFRPIITYAIIFDLTYLNPKCGKSEFFLKKEVDILQFQDTV